MIDWDDRWWDAIDQAFSEMEAAWQAGAPAKIGALVPPKNHPRHLQILATLVKLDLEHGWEVEKPCPIEAYLEQWPELKEDEVLVDLIQTEYRVRHAGGDPPASDELSRRFPSLTEIEGLLEELRLENLASPGEVTAVIISDRTEFDTICAEAQGKPQILSPGTQVGRYRISGVLGRGGMGTVYLAHDDDLDRPVAIKLLHRHITRDREGDNLLQAEARTIARLRHSAIVPVFDIGTGDDGTLYFVMEYVEGKSLDEVLAKQAISTGQALTWIGQVANALESAHQHGFVHRDIKPANILIDTDGNARVTDFGLAIHEDAAQPAGELCGTLPYMAPEQLDPDLDPCGAHTDVWALGCVLFEMLTGDRPFAGETFPELRDAILQDDPLRSERASSRIPAPLRQICCKCLEKASSKRYPNAASLNADLTEYPQTPLSRRSGAAGPTVLLLALAALLAGAFSFTPLQNAFRPQPPPGIDQTGNEHSPRDFSEKEPGARSRNTGPPQQSSWISPCKLAVYAETGAEIHLDAAKDYVFGCPGRLLSPHQISYDQSRADVVRDSVRIQDQWLCWEMPLEIRRPTNLHDSIIVPTEFSLRLRIAVNRAGCFWVGTVGPEKKEHLLVLTCVGGVDNYRYFGGRTLPRDKFKEPRNWRLELADRQTLPAEWFASLYEMFRKNDLLREGPANRAELYDCRIELHNYFSQPIHLVHGQIFHQRFDFGVQAEDLQPINEAMNRRWSPIAETPNQNAELSWTVKMRCDPNADSALVVRSHSDVDNSSQFRLTGLTFPSGEPYSVEGTRSFLSYDLEEGTCEGGDRHGQNEHGKIEVGGARVLLYGEAPKQIELNAVTRWSIVDPWYRYVSFGNVDILDCRSTPTLPDDKSIQPLQWTIEPTSTGKER